MKCSIKIKTHRYVEKLAQSSMQNSNSLSEFTQLTEIWNTLLTILSSTNRTTRIFADPMASALFSNVFPYFQTRDFLFNSDINTWRKLAGLGWSTKARWPISHISELVYLQTTILLVVVTNSIQSKFGKYLFLTKWLNSLYIFTNYLYQYYMEIVKMNLFSEHKTIYSLLRFN